ncbi:MAG: hypothetical protein AABX03_01460 [Nanoarchaeota archaeon]
MNSRVSYDSKLEIARSAVEMYVDQREKTNIKGEEYEGRISTHGEVQFLGSYGGQVFNVFLDSDNGKESLSFLLHDHTRKDHREVGALN